MPLKPIYEEYVMGDPKIMKMYKYKMNRIAEEMIKGICSKSSVLNMFYCKNHPHTTGSHWDKLTVGNTRQECDVNVCFDFPVSLEFKEGDDRPNFWYCVVSNTDLVEDLCSYDPRVGHFISPLKLFREFVRAGQEFLYDNHGTLEVNIPSGNERETFRFQTKTKIGAPWTVFFQHEGLENIEMDLVPAIILPRRLVRSGEVQQRIEFIESIHGDVGDKCLAICLHKADPNRFQIDFHEVEKKILEEKGFIKMIIRLIKYLRNVWKEPLSELSSHVIKSAVMQKVLSEEVDYWSRHQNLELNFRECFQDLVERVERGFVRDVIWDVNILEVKIKNPITQQFLAESLTSLQTLMAVRGIDEVFQKKGVCLVCDQYTSFNTGPAQHMLEEHAWSKYTAYQAATCTDEDHMQDMLKELEQLSLRDRACTYTKKAVICPHCLEIFSTKQNLLSHICVEHPKFRRAAGMALKDGEVNLRDWKICFNCGGPIL